MCCTQMECNLFNPKRQLSERQKSLEIQKEDITKEQHIQD